MRNKILPVILITLVSVQLSAQEKIVPLTYNPELVNMPKHDHSKFSYRGFRSTPDLETPFFDDFSWSSGYPDDTLWMDSNVFVNNRMAIMPTSIGVATFDGLNQYGMPYDPGITDSKGKIADELTSIPLDLSGYNESDSIYLSFTYQAQGLGDKPESYDSFVVEIKPDSIWTGTVWDKDAWYRIWSVEGGAVNDFKQVILHIPEKVYDTSVVIGNIYHDAFQFRFLNYGSLAGNHDLWHLDYVYLGKGRSVDDLYFEDLAVVYDPPSLLKSYNSIPWTHLIADQSQIRDDLSIIVRNLNDAPLKARGGYELIDTFDNDQILFNDNANSQDIYTVLDFPLSSTIKSELDLNSVSTADTFALGYHVVNFNTANDEQLTNNYGSRYQEFSNYYAYDDGTAELGYGVSNASYSQVAYKFTMANNFPTSDSLRGILIFFNQSLDNTSYLPIDLMVWKDKEDDPIYSLETYTPTFDVSEPNVFYYYNFDTVLAISGEFYIGWEQYSDFYLNVGLDMNYFMILGDSVPTKSNSNLFYYANNTWRASSAQGALMMRPVFSSVPVLNAIENPVEKSDRIRIYPVPAHDQVYIDGIEQESYVHIFNLQGQCVMNTTLFESGKINVRDLDDGFYLLRVYSKQGNVISNHKLIKK